MFVNQQSSIQQPCFVHLVFFIILFFLNVVRSYVSVSWLYMDAILLLFVSLHVFFTESIRIINWTHANFISAIKFQFVRWKSWQIWEDPLGN